MFALPQPESSPSIPSIPVQEGSAVLDRALRFFYPGAQPVVGTLDELREIFEVLISKYDIQCIVPTAKARLETYLIAQPVAVYAIAFNHEWKDVAIKAARQALSIPLRVVDSVAPPELDHITASAYHNLLHYHTRCSVSAKVVTEDLRWVSAPNDYVWFSCRACEAAKLAWYLSDGAVHAVRLWFDEYLKSLGDVLNKTPGIDLHRHQTMLDALASASKCATCRQKAFEQLPAFISTVLTARIKALVDEVRTLASHFGRMMNIIFLGGVEDLAI
jgi:hypothetical protein